MLNKELLGRGVGEPLTLTVQPYSLGYAKIGDQEIYPWGSYYFSSPPVVVDYSTIDDLSAMIEVYMDGKTTLQGYIVENINVTFFGMEYPSTWFRGYIIDKTKSSSITWQ